MIELSKLGLDVEHGEYSPGKHFIGVFSDREIEKIQATGFAYEVLIDDLSNYRRTHFHDQSAIHRNPGPCGENIDNPTQEIPENFEMGSFLGFFTYEEYLENLDSMVAKYPDIISVRAPIEGILTHENRPIYWIKISDNPNIDETEPEVLYTAVHHAREPGGLASLIYFMWYTLENYESDPAIQAMVNETELFLIPCLNPDGYIYNVNNYLNGGSIFWRKNRRDNGDGTFGVDLNRNYGYEFGYDNIGSSPETSSAVYRGPSAFSEPETQASKQFCEAHNFQVALNYHTYGNLLIYPWGYDNVGVPDTTFLALADAMVEENNFFAGTVFETLNYYANGNSDDWMYGEQTTKPAIYALTPELGLGGFYPAESDVLPIIQSSLSHNISTSLLAHPLGKIEYVNELTVPNTGVQAFNFMLTNVGLQGGNFTVSLSPISTNISDVGPAKNFTLGSQASVQDFLEFQVDNVNINTGDEIVFTLSIDNGSYTDTDTITKIFGSLEPIISENGDNLDNWFTNSWSTTNTTFVTPSSSITDSPVGNYFPNTLNQLILTDPISLVDVDNAILNFWAKWDIEKGWDFVQVGISTDDGLTFEPQCGLYTSPGSGQGPQALDEPLYDGTQDEWIKERIDLSNYLGEEIMIQFLLMSDGAVEADGFYLDDLEVSILTEGVVSTQTIELDNLEVRTYPNPGNNFIKLELNTFIPDAQLNVYNAQGSAVYLKAYQNETIMKIPVKDWPAGMYFYQLENQKTGQLLKGKFVVQ
jgi:hypothetical protein